MRRRILTALTAIMLILPLCACADGAREKEAAAAEERVRLLREERGELAVRLAAIEAENGAMEAFSAELENIRQERYAAQDALYGDLNLVFEKLPARYSALNEKIAGYDARGTGTAIGAEEAKARLRALFEGGDTTAELYFDGGILVLQAVMPEIYSGDPGADEEREDRCFAHVETAARELETVVSCASSLGAELFILKTDYLNLHVDMEKEMVSVFSQRNADDIAKILKRAGVAE